jgi:hypothetical protein
MNRSPSSFGSSTRLVVLTIGSVVCGVVASVLAVVILGGGQGLWLNSWDSAKSLHEDFVVKQLARLRVESAKARGSREARGDLARGDMRMKVMGLPEPWFRAYQEKVINTYDVGIDELGCVIDDELTAYASAYNEESAVVIRAKVGEDKLDEAYRAAEADWTRQQAGADSQSTGVQAVAKHGPFAFDFDCARPADFPHAELVLDVATAVLRKDGKRWADRAVKYDLDRDGHDEYFVPTVCGATGNCEWGVFRLSPTRALGQLTGDRVYITGDRRWPQITTYDRFGLGKGEVHEYEFRSGKYFAVTDRMVEDDENNGFLKRMGDPRCSGR